ncbi:MAG: ATPase [Lentimicrobiaceae bacterium]|nr:ATPase [Lentimicrobiaceae bacterium]
METPFVYGKLATLGNYTNRQKELQLLKNNFVNLINTTIISPRRWGKSSLVNHVSQIIQKEHNTEIIMCHLDIFNCRTEEQFYKAYANAILRSTSTKWEEFVAGVKKYLGRFLPKISFSDATQAYELSFGIELKEAELSLDEILDLPQQIASDTGKKIVVCIDEFQNINEYGDSLAFQRKLRAHWQLHNKVCYCLYGSKRHLLMNIFNSYEMPFYKFGDILFLQKISREDWVKFISERFTATGKQISDTLSGKIADTMQNHPYYVQQYSQQVWLRTDVKCTEMIMEEALEGLIDQLSLLFTNIIDSLAARQIAFLTAIVAGETNFSSKEVLKKYDLGTSANIKNLKNALLEKDLIDILPHKTIELQDPVLLLWLKKVYLD